jgi:hypothetical protein
LQCGKDSTRCNAAAIVTSLHLFHGADDDEALEAITTEAVKLTLEALAVFANATRHEVRDAFTFYGKQLFSACE